MDQQQSDHDLLLLLQAGDERAFELIYHRYAASLYRYARKNISIKEECEEIIQDIFTDLWSRRETLKHVTVLNAYLFKMVKYKVIRYFRHNAVKQKYEDHFRFFEAVYENTSEIQREASTLQTIIEKGLEALPERCRHAVKLRLTENLSNSDIAMRMNIKKTTVENYMVTALRHLKSLKVKIIQLD